MCGPALRYAPGLIVLDRISRHSKTETDWKLSARKRCRRRMADGRCASDVRPGWVRWGRVSDRPLSSGLSANKLATGRALSEETDRAKISALYPGLQSLFVPSRGGGGGGGGRLLISAIHSAACSA